MCWIICSFLPLCSWNGEIEVFVWRLVFVSCRVLRGLWCLHHTLLLLSCIQIALCKHLFTWCNGSVLLQILYLEALVKRLKFKQQTIIFRAIVCRHWLRWSPFCCLKMTFPTSCCSCWSYLTRSFREKLSIASLCIVVSHHGPIFVFCFFIGQLFARLFDSEACYTSELVIVQSFESCCCWRKAQYKCAYCYY